MSPANCGETESILLNDAWIKRVEIKEQDDRIIEASLGIKDQSSSILCLLSLWLAFALLVLILLGRSLIDLHLIVSKHGLSSLF